MTGPRVVVIGAGHGGTQVAAELRAHRFEGAITLVGEEGVHPYHRPPLSKAYMAGEKSAGQIALRGPAFYAEQGIETAFADGAARIDRAARQVVLASGRLLDYDHLVLATGALPRRLPVPGADLPGVFLLRTLADSAALRGALAQARQAVVIGAGFIGLECAASLKKAGLAVTVIEALERVMARAVTPEISAHFAALHRAHGVDLKLGTGVGALIGDRHVEAVETRDGARIAADLVVVGIGVVPNVALAEAAGFATNNGITVDETLRTADPRIFAIGDCACWPGPDGPLRLESVQNAVDQAKSVALAILGRAEPYRAVPWFWSDQYDAKLQMAGLSAGADARIVRTDAQRGGLSVFAFRDERLIAVETVNAAGDHMRARKLLGGSQAIGPADLDTAFSPGPRVR